MTGNEEAARYWRQVAEETHAKLVAAREALARTNSDKYAHYARQRAALVELVRALSEPFALREARSADVAVALREARESLGLEGGGK